MHKCEICGREFSRKASLTNHRKSCEPTEEEITEEVVSNEVVEAKELSDNIIRKIEKLKAARKSTWDAHARHEIDMQIAALKRGD